MRQKIILIASCIILFIYFIGAGVFFYNKYNEIHEQASNLEHIDITIENNDSINENGASNESDDITSENEKDNNLLIQEPETPETPETEPQTCQHTYSKEYIEKTCTTDGLLIYTCTKCDYSYEEIIKGSHEYEKYFCSLCGKIDPQSSIFWAITFWLKNNGQPNGAGTMYCYPNDTSPLRLCSHLDTPSLYMEYYDGVEQFMVYLDNKNSCYINYAVGNTRGSFSVANSAFSSASNIVFDSFSTPSDNPVTANEFAAQCTQKVDTYMYRFQNEILLPYMGLSLKDLGFSCY